jgi:peptidoglycan hydrolase-like protein with peptidoglycan-binding domain
MYSKGHQVPGFAPAAAMPPPSAPPVAMGPDPALVRATQAELIRLQYLNGSADGAMGPHTAEAIRAYQQASGLPVTGAPSQALLARLQATPGGGAPASASAAAPAAWVPPKTQ